MISRRQSGRHFLQYWKPKSVDLSFEELPRLDHSASDQFGRIGLRPGDTLWIATVRAGRLYLVGRLLVEQIERSTKRANKLVKYEVWAAKYHAIALKTAEPMRNISISGGARRLRFKSLTTDRLTVHGGRITAQPLQTIRELTDATVQLFARKWAKHQSTPLQPQTDTAMAADASLVFGDLLDQAELDLKSREGRRILRAHLVRERSAALVRAFKRRLVEFSCAICGFDFQTCYGQLGHGFIEAHHKTPIAADDRGRTPKLKDLISVCSNCHRMLHRSQPPVTPDQLKVIIRGNRIRR